MTAYQGPVFGGSVGFKYVLSVLYLVSVPSPSTLYRSKIPGLSNIANNVEVMHVHLQSHRAGPDTWNTIVQVGFPSVAQAVAVG
jgi:hypothetical protein